MVCNLVKSASVTTNACGVNTAQKSPDGIVDVTLEDHAEPFQVYKTKPYDGAGAELLPLADITTLSSILLIFLKLLSVVLLIKLMVDPSK